MRHEIKIVLVEHKTAKSVVVGYFMPEFPHSSAEQILKKKTEFNIVQNTTKLHNIVKKSVTVGQLLQNIKHERAWGYCNHKTKYTKEIHYWIGKGATMNKVLELFGHELAHAFGYSNEKTAQKVGIITCLAYNMYIEDVKKEGQ